jgi:hypothetical protein
MRLSQRFLAQIRQYAALEQQLSRDYSEMVITISVNEEARLVEAGVAPADALQMVNSALAQNVTRFPVQLSES